MGESERGVERPAGESEYRFVRSATTAFLLVNGLLAAAAIVLGVVGLVYTIASVVGGESWRWAQLILGVSMSALGGLFCWMLVRTHHADRELGDVPAPAADEAVVLAVRPRLGWVFAVWLLWTAAFLTVGVGICLRWRELTEPELAVPMELLESMASRGIDMSVTFDRIEAQRMAETGGGCIMLSTIAFMAMVGSKTWLWLLTNRRRAFVWFSATGVGYLPGFVGDPGYLRWDEVRSVAYAELMEGRAFWTTGHLYKIRSTLGFSTTVRTEPGIAPKWKEVRSTLGELAPGVKRYGPDPNNPWGDVVPQIPRVKGK